MIQKFRRYLAAIILIVAPLLSLAAPGVAHASGGGTFTWSGGSGSGGDWSLPLNWLGGAAPQPGDVGDTVIIDNSQNFGSTPVDNISSLSLTSLEFENNSSGNAPITIDLDDPLTITGSINQESSDTGTSDIITDNGSAETITIGGNVAVTSSAGGLTLGQSRADNLAITSGDSLSFNDGGSANVLAIVDDITNVSGSGTVTYNGANTTYELSGDNTYVGTTNIEDTGSAGVEVLASDPFGTSTVDIANDGGYINFFSGISSLANTVNVTGSASTTPDPSIQFNDTMSSGTFTLPAVVLDGNSQFVNDASPGLSVNLTGITSNGYCLEYSGANGTATTETTNTFTNGPTECGASSSSSGSSSSGSTTTAAPTAPDTGLALVAAHPAETLVLTLAATTSILGIAFRLKSIKR